MKKDYIEGEIVGEEKKKTSKFSRFLEKAKNKFEQSSLSLKIRNYYSKDHKEFRVYQGDSFINSDFISFNVEDHIKEGYVIALTEDAINPKGILYDFESKKAYYIDSLEKTTLNIEFEGKSYTRNAMKIFFSNEAIKVDVIKCDGAYYKVKE